MASLGFSYLPRLVIDESTNNKLEVFTPYVPIMVSFNRGNPTRLIDALVDSGSDRNLFPLQLGQMLGMNFKKIKPKIIFGIGSIRLKAYTCKINIWVNNKEYGTEADFCLEQQTLLLGRQGFFNLFKQVKFDEKGRFLYLETYK
ncbi:hypothetical protein A2870_02845 [Candidatus Curtissbacteria bacterium RIFCSPHIGHO2_01_FULL_41_11]|uniref:Peptidase A2 domain-containing protein n=1 Tax=Candidatus Curtissbacteria bacterium RIFCSPHIGHO2_01_FULL_41_11 TaxID=1797711 RepID=A0A1F5G5E4_9BACT|nr:MAG: hypothetical protein A2870_02845 [Candidatus Curtissbacteria bacterium RIFCSPHIGHO2_01_FULL_41_11]